jgi:hypothetical protein
VAINLLEEMRRKTQKLDEQAMRAEAKEMAKANLDHQRHFETL